MPNMMEHVAFLSQNVGPRPAGTEEEQQAALYITEQLQQDAGLSAHIEDFNETPAFEAPRVICCGITIVITVLSMFFNVLMIPAIILTLLALGLMVADIFGKPILQRFFPRGVSQNVVAKFEPGYSEGGTRRRKVIFVARYDSGKIKKELNGSMLNMIPKLQWATLGAMIFVPVLLIIRSLFFLNTPGVPEIVLNVITVLALILCALPLVGALVHKTAGYNEGANSNASGVAVLLEVAKRVGRGASRATSDRAGATDAKLHGEEALRAAGVIPEGASLEYNASPVPADPNIDLETPADRLAAAKAAIAALTGKPIDTTPFISVADNLVQTKEPALPEYNEENVHEMREDVREALTGEAALHESEAAYAAGVSGEGAELTKEAAPQEEPVQEPVEIKPAVPLNAAAVAFGVSTETPDWFKRAQEKAKKPAEEAAPAQRSVFADALDAAIAGSANSFEAANEAVQAGTSIPEQKLRQMRESIMDVKAPKYDRENVGLVEGETSAEAANETGAQPADGQVVAQTAPQEVTSVAEAAPAAPVAQETVSDLGATTAMAPVNITEPQVGINKSENQAASLEVPSVTGTEQGVSADSTAALPMQPAEEPVQAETVASQVAPKPARRPITLPDITAPAAPISEMKQRAPLASSETGTKDTAKSLLTMLPSINLEHPEESAVPSVPEIPAVQPAEEPENFVANDAYEPEFASGDADATQLINPAGAFGSASATGAFAPVGNELLQDVNPDDMYVDDVDDSAYETSYTETGAFAGPGYVEMPKSRAQRLFDKFRRKKDEEEVSTQQWLHVDDNFDARQVGAARGGWESFREDSEYEAGVQEDFAQAPADATQAINFDYDQNYDQNYADGYDQGYVDDYEDGYEDGYYEDGQFENAPNNQSGRSWNGGAFSRFMKRKAQTEEAEDVAEGYDEYADEPELEEMHGEDVRGTSRRSRNAFQPRDSFDFNEAKEEIEQTDLTALNDTDYSGAIGKIHTFHASDITTEVWFVALGSELCGNGGMRAFLNEHAQDLHGAVIVELDSLGAGELSLVEKEGKYRPVKASSRMKRYVKKAAQATGMRYGTVDFSWQETSSSCAAKAGYQTLHLVGAEGNKPALYGQIEDVLENVNPETLEENANFVTELLHNI